MLEYLEYDEISVAELFRFFYPLEYYLLVGDLFDLQSLMRFEFLLGGKVQDHQPEAEDIGFERVSACNFIIFSLY